MNEEDIDDVVLKFHKLYYSNGGRTWSGNTLWHGRKVLKCPFDLWNYQEIIYETKPDFIIDIGTGEAGCTMFLASMCDLMEKGKILSVDTENTNHALDLPEHDRIFYITGSSIDENTVSEIRRYLKFPLVENIMVILDSDHHKEHVLKELEIYSRFVRKGNYIIVEDTNLSGHPNYTDFEGPWEAVAEFLGKNEKFVIDKNREKFYLTFNPNGYLKRV